MLGFNIGVLWFSLNKSFRFETVVSVSVQCQSLLLLHMNNKLFFVKV